MEAVRPYLVTHPNESLRGSIASLLERPLSHVPDFDMACTSPTWLVQLNDWTREHFACTWVATFLTSDPNGKPITTALWTPPGWYLEGAESEDGLLTIFQVCSGGVTMHRPFPVTGRPFIARCRLWPVVIDPARAWLQA